MESRRDNPALCCDTCTISTWSGHVSGAFATTRIEPELARTHRELVHVYERGCRLLVSTVLNDLRRVKQR